jgi:hypothetical protein
VIFASLIFNYNLAGQSIREFAVVTATPAFTAIVPGAAPPENDYEIILTPIQSSFSCRYRNTQNGTWSGSAVAAAKCSTTVSNKIGDTIFFTTNIVSSDPNDPVDPYNPNSENQSLFVSTSGGEINVVILEYIISIPFSYRATQTNETITGTFPGADGDELCVIIATVNPAPGLTKSQKETASIAAAALDALATLAGALNDVCVPPASLYCKALLLTTTGAGALAKILDQAAIDPSDPNFTVIARPNIPSIPSLQPGNGLTGREAAAFNNLTKIDAAIVGTAFAAITSANRAQGAKDANSAYWEQRQSQVTQNYAHQLGVLLDQEIDRRQRLYDALTAAGVTASVTPREIFAFEQKIAASGLPSDWIQGLTQFGLDQNQITDVARALSLQGSAAAGMFPASLISPGLLGALESAAQAFKGTD